MSLRIPITRLKIAGARLLYRLVKLTGHPDVLIAERHGIRFKLDLREGIDLSVFLFGAFQKHVFSNKLYALKPDAIVLDVGANAGFMTLQFARLCPQGHVYAFEPTHYAVQRFRENMLLNPELAQRVTFLQCFVSDKAESQPHLVAYASWPVAGNPAGTEAAVHAVHLGRALSTEGVPAITLDVWMEDVDPRRVDFIKIDTDGHEWSVLRGAEKLIARFKPAIIFEIGQYVMEEKGLDFNSYLSFFQAQKYKLYNSAGGQLLTASNWKKIIPRLGTIDVLALPIPS
jgi:FkbM family methyltransferase